MMEETSVRILTAVPQSFVLVFLFLVFLILRVLFFRSLLVILLVRVFVVVPAVSNRNFLQPMCAFR